MRWRINYFFKLLKNLLIPPKPLLHPWQLQDQVLKSRRNDDIADGICKLLKCKPSEMIERINRLQQEIGELEAKIATFAIQK